MSENSENGQQSVESVLSKDVEMRGKLKFAAHLSDWSESELLYFPFSPRVIKDADADSVLESGIAEHFSNVQAVHSVNKAQLARDARIAGLKLHHMRSEGEVLSDKEVKDIIAAQDAMSKSAVVRRPRKASDVHGPLVSRSDIINGPAPDSRSPFKPGLFIIYGGADSNKSHRLRKLYEFTRDKLAGEFESEYVIVGEPDHRSIGSWAETISVLRYGFVDGDDTYVPDVMFVDSLKDLLYMPGDAGSGAGGLSMDATMELSGISAQLMREGRTVVAVVNPSQPKYIHDMYETLKSNVTGVFFYNPPAKSQQKEEVEHFNQKRMARLLSSFRVWNTNDYYDRISDGQIMNLVGLDGDILDANLVEVKAQTVSRAVVTAARTSKDLVNRVRRQLMMSTPKND